MSDNKIPKLGPVELTGASEYITISVAEYHFLTKLATLLEAVLSADKYNPKPVVDAVRKTVEEMTEAGAEE